MENSINSPLLRLPREIRDIIWDYAVGTYNIIPLYEPTSFGKPKRRRYAIRNAEIKDASSKPRAIFAKGGIAGTCRQMRAETRDLQVQRTIFRFVYAMCMKEFCATYHDWIASMKVESIATDWSFYTEDARISFKELWPDLKRIYIYVGRGVKRRVDADLITYQDPTLLAYWGQGRRDTCYMSYLQSECREFMDPFEGLEIVFCENGS